MRLRRNTLCRTAAEADRSDGCKIVALVATTAQTTICQRAPDAEVWSIVARTPVDSNESSCAMQSSALPSSARPAPLTRTARRRCATTCRATSAATAIARARASLRSRTALSSALQWRRLSHRASSLLRVTPALYAELDRSASMPPVSVWCRSDTSEREKCSLLGSAAKACRLMCASQHCADVHAVKSHSNDAAALFHQRPVTSKLQLARRAEPLRSRMCTGGRLVMLTCTSCNAGRAFDRPGRRVRRLRGRHHVVHRLRVHADAGAGTR